MKVSYFDYIKKTDVSTIVAEIIFNELSSQYPIQKIEEVVDSQSGGTPSRTNAEYYGGEIPWLKSGELNDGFIEKSEEFITEKGLVNSSAKIVPDGTLLIAMYGATVGKTGITRIRTATNQAICAIFPKDGVERDYLYWFFRSHRYKFIEMSKGGAQPNISQTVILNTKLPLPSKDVQNRIITLLNKINANENFDVNHIPVEYREKVNGILNSKNTLSSLESEIDNQNDLLKSLRQAFLREAMQGKLVPQDPNDDHASELLKRIKEEKEKLIAEGKIKKVKNAVSPFGGDKEGATPYQIPPTWVWCRLGEICSKIGSGSTPRGSNYSKNGVPFFRSQNIQDNGLVYDDIKYISDEVHNSMNSTMVYAKDILLNITGGSLGRCAFVNSSFSEGNVSQHVCIIRPVSISNEYMHKVILSPYFRKLIFSSTTGAGREGLPKYNLEQFMIPLPPLAEQQRIVSKLNQLMQFCDQLEQNINTTKEQTNLLLQTVLSEALEPKATLQSLNSSINNPFSKE